MSGGSREERRARLSPAKQALLARRLQGASARPAPETPRRPPNEPPRLAPEQRGLWTLHLLAPEDPTYHLVSVMRVEGQLDPRRLRHALHRVAGRHRILRSGWRPEGETARQVIEDEPAIPLDVTETPVGETASIRDFARAPFDLERPPLLRVRLIRHGPEADRLIVVLPHLVSDEQGLHTFWRDLAAAYDDALPEEPAVQFDDVVWARQQEPDRRDADLAYWRSVLATPVDAGFPPDAASPAAGTSGALRAEPLPADAAAAVEAFARARDITPFAVYLTVYFALLRAMIGSPRPAVGCPVSTRERPEEQGVIGYFLNAVVLAPPAEEASSFAEAATALQAAILEALQHRRLPFDQLVEALHPARPPGEPPWFQTMLVMVEDMPAVRLGEARLRPERVDIGVAKFDLTIFIAASGAEPWIGAEYRTGRFDADGVRRLLARYLVLLRGALTRPDQPMNRLEVLLPEESAQLFSLWQPAPLDVSGAPWVRDQILEHCRHRPDAIAVRGGGQAWSYQRLEAWGRRVQAALEERGVQAGDRVGLLLERSPEMAAAILGVHGAGAAYVPLDPEWPPARLRSVHDDADLRALVTSAALSAACPDAPLRDTLRRDALILEALPDRPAAPYPLRGVLPAYLIYTSGSTGRPKGVVITQENLRASNHARSAAYAEPPAAFLLLSGFAFDSSVAGVFWTLCAGGTLVIPSAAAAREPAALRDLIARRRVTHLLGIPSLIREILRNETEKLQSLRAVIAAGESCPVDLVTAHRNALPGATFVNEYGPTEATVWAAFWRDQGEPLEQTPIGAPAPHARIYVLDSARRPTPPGVPGTGWIGGAGVAAAYWRRDDLTAERFQPDPFVPGEGARMYDTGDRLRWRPDGQLEFLGRQDDQLKVQGMRLEPEEIEGALRAAPGVRDACVVLHRPPADPARGETGEGRLTAFVVTGREPLDAADLRRRLREQLPEAASPERFVAVDALPALPNGKTDRAALARCDIPADAADAASPPGIADRDCDPILRAVLAQWRALMDLPGLAARDNVFARGAHSMQVIQCAEALSGQCGIRIPVAVVFQHPAPYDLANWIRLHRTVDQPPAYRHVFPVHIEGNGAPLFAIQPDFTSGILSEALRGRRPVYGLRGIGLRPEGNAGRWPDMAALADDMLTEIQEVQPDGPYRLSGYSLGAVIAFEVARRLEARGLEVIRLVLFDPTPWNMVHRGPFRFQLRQCRRPVTELTLARAWMWWLVDNRPWAPFLWRRLGRVLLASPYRWIMQDLARRRRNRGRPLTPRMMQADSDAERFRLFFRYQPGPVSAPTLFFNAQGPDYDAATLWRPFLAGPLEVCDIDTVHQQVGATPATRAVVVAKLREVL